MLADIISMLTIGRTALPPDEPDRDGSVKVGGEQWEWLGKVHPVSPTGRYRVIRYDDRITNCFGLQAFVSGDWVTVQVYDSGFDDYGKFSQGRWRNIADEASWREKELFALSRALQGRQDEDVVVVAEVM